MYRATCGFSCGGTRNVRSDQSVAKVLDYLVIRARSRVILSAVGILGFSRSERKKEASVERIDGTFEIGVSPCNFPTVRAREKRYVHESKRA